MTASTFAELGGPATPWLLVFDLDGTLIDSSIDLCNAVNAALVHVQHPPLAPSLIARFIGDGAATLVRRALEASAKADREGVIRKINEQQFDSSLALFLDFYREHKLDNTRAYDGVLASLEALHSRQPEVPMAVLTNKPVHPSRDLCAALHLAPFFFANYGGNSFSTKKPDPHGFRVLMAEARDLWNRRGVPSEQLGAKGAVMIGDSDVDVLTARRCGARSLGCRYGLAPQALEAASPDLIVDRPEQWVTALSL